MKKPDVSRLRLSGITVTVLTALLVLAWTNTSTTDPNARPSDQMKVAADSTRSLAEFYARRAFPGAPPYIPHELSDPNAYGGRACLRCHERSRFVSRIGAYTPITPHPELVSCRSCHMLPVTTDLFVETDWEKPAPPTLTGGALPDSPPPIPHSLQLRENCAVCHTGPGSVPELRTPHPEEEECLDCHATVETDGEWNR